MRIILSRKGFDSQYGGGPSPILPDGRICSLPIPHTEGPFCYQDLESPLGNLGQLLKQLSPKAAKPDDRVHLDPDLFPESLPRRANWRPCFGQHGAAQQHLAKQGVQAGDLFLFFGWFRSVDAEFRPLPNSPDLHVIFGWLQVGQLHSLTGNPETSNFADPVYKDHPHFHGEFGLNNTLYLARDSLDFFSQRGSGTTDLPGGGLFNNIHPRRILTRPGGTRSRWQLPGWFAHPTPALSYHMKPEKWQPDGENWHLTSAPKGQEFVINTQGRHTAAKRWLKKLFEDQQ
ncbi:hypothetical protein O4H49_08700 [Kiloniella laminariae]|uniref:Nucleotide modification associated domain-containing protein n=1 Tax=Kiloniella laminariae TaxID=454162 RepID=A0ABT4LIB3_9PROT|nr:hypothetical protein [Kiloniella laminariae]MCZ4280852.1 hypothetical protein [Kiloniella laminariae]